MISHSSPNILLHSQGLSNTLYHSHRPRTYDIIPMFPSHLVLFRAPYAFNEATDSKWQSHTVRGVWFEISKE